MYKHILLPTDGSEQSEQAIEQGVRLASLLGARVTGVHVVVESHVAAGIGSTLMHHMDDGSAAAKQFLSVVEAAAKAADVPFECFVLRGGSAAEAILHAATKQGCDLIFMHSHGRSGLARMLLGSDTSQVLHGSHVPVLVHRN